MNTQELQDLIRQTEEATGLVNPHDIAAKTLVAIDDADLRDALSLTLPAYVRRLVTTQRRPCDLGHESEEPPRRQQPARSAKVTAVRSWHARVLAQAVDVSGYHGQWKRLAECTRDELLAVAAHRRGLAAANVATAERYEALARRMQVDDARTVGELSHAALAAIFSERAA